MMSIEKIFELVKFEKKFILCNYDLSCMYFKLFLFFFLKKYIGKLIKYYGINL